MNTSQHRILMITAELFPTNESFLTEVYSIENKEIKTIFLMRTNKSTNHRNTVTWNKSKVYIFPHPSKYKILKPLDTYFFIDPRFIYLIPYIALREKISVIQVRDITFPLFIALILKFLFRKKVVYQKSFPHEYRKTDSEMISKYKIPWLIKFCRVWENKALHFMMKFCDAILPISEHMGKNLQDDYGLPAGKIHPFGMGFNFESLLPKKTIPDQVNAKLFKLIYIGAHSRREIDLLIHGLAKTIKSNQHYEIQIDFFGGVSEEIDELKQVAQQCNIGQYCHFNGRIERAEVYSRVLDSHIGIAWVGRGIRYSVASPTKTIEYLSLGIPIIATDSVFLHKDIIKDTNAGVCCHVEPDDFAKQLSMIMQHYDVYKNNALNSRTYMKEKYSYTSMRNRVVQLYDSL